MAGCRVPADTAESGVDVGLLTAVAYATFAVYGAMVTATGPTLPGLAREFHLSLGQAGTMYAAGGVGFVLVVFLAGYASDALGKQRVMVAGLVAAAVGGLGIGLAPTFEVVLGAAFVQNLGYGLLESSVGALVADVHAARRTAALNVLHSFFGGGALVGPLFAGAMIVSVGWRWAYLGLAIGFLAMVPLVARRRFPRLPRGEAIHWREVGDLLRSPLVQVAGAGILLYVAGELSLSAWGGPYLEAFRGFPTLVASLGVAVFWAAIAAGRWASSRLSARVSAVRIIQGSAVLCALGAGAVMLATTPFFALAGMAIAGLGAAAIYPTVMALACARFPRRTGTVTGLITTATALGSLLGPAAVGRLGDALGLQQALLAVVVAMLLLAGLYAWPAAGEGDS